MSIINDCVVLNIKLGAWAGHKLDKVKSHEVNAAAGAESDATNVNKHLMPKTALAPIVTAHGVLRTLLYKHTLRWKNNGDRLITRKGYLDFLEKWHEGEAAANAAVEHFITVDFAQARERAAFRMGNMFDPSDYPTISQLRRKFYVQMDVDAVSIPKDFGLEDSEQIAQDRITTAVSDLWQKLQKPLKHFADTLSKPEVLRLHESSINNLKAVAELIPALNFANDPQLNAIADDILKLVGSLDVKDLKKDKDARLSIGAEAQKVVDTMAGFMKAMGHSQAEEDDDGEA